MRITVTYPLGSLESRSARLVLRTDLDWDADLLPVEVLDPGLPGALGDRVVFDIPFSAPFHAVKPCIRDSDALHWSKGSDYVLSAHEPDPDIWPYFFGEERGRVSEILRVPCVEGDERSHAVRVYFPPGYDENTLRRFPVVYMNDGQNLFLPEEAFAGQEWQVDETMDRLDRMNAIRKALVVGVAPADRMLQYTHPGYQAYGRFMVERLKPLMDELFRTRPGPTDTVVMGSSLGGVVSLYLAWEHPGVFGRAACLSSTFGFQDDLFQRIENEPKRDILLYLDSGWPRDNFDATNAMRDLLLSRGYVLGQDLVQFSFPDGKHDEGSWSGRLHVPFQFFLGRAWASLRQPSNSQIIVGRNPA